MYKNVVVPLDGSELAECVFPHVETVVKGCKEPNIILLRVVEPVRIMFGEEYPSSITFEQIQQAEDLKKEEAEKYLNRISEKLAKAGIKTTVKIMSGNPAQAIVDYVDHNNIDLVILATHGRSGVSRWIWGSVADRILRSICIPIFMVRAPGCGLLSKN